MTAADNHNNNSSKKWQRRSSKKAPSPKSTSNAASGGGFSLIDLGSSDYNNNNGGNNAMTPSSSTTIPPPPPNDDVFMSDSPRQQQQNKMQVAQHLDGLHHRSSRRYKLSSSVIQQQSLDDYNGISGSGYNNGYSHNHYQGGTLQPNNSSNNSRAQQRTTRRFFNFYNPYHGTTTTNNSNTNNMNSPNNHHSKRSIISPIRILQCIVCIIFLGYIMLLGYTHSIHNNIVDGGNSSGGQSLIGNEEQVDGGDDDNLKLHQKEEDVDNIVGGSKLIRSSSSSIHRNAGTQQQQQHQPQQQQHRYDERVKSTTSIIAKLLDHLENDNDDEARDYRIVSLHDLSRRPKRRRGNVQQQQLYSKVEEEEFIQPPPKAPQLDANMMKYYRDMAKKKQRERRNNRKMRTTPPFYHLSSKDDGSSTQQQQQSEQKVENDASSSPTWYKLDHSSFNTVLANQKRWDDQENNDNKSASSSHLLDTNFNLCGQHAHQGASNHPQNYYPPLSSTTTTNHNQDHHNQPLNSQSRVLITGILSPLGFHLTLALHRQCNITQFIGVDTQMPNDPLSRLEMEDRLLVLLDEIQSGGKSLWYVPFLGLEGKPPKNTDVQQKWEESERRRQRLLVHIRNHPHHFIIDESNNDNDASPSSSTFNAQPYKKFGIPPSPGVNHQGYGTLDIIAEYRPTHIVHLAGSQSESFLSSKRKRNKKQSEEEGDGESGHSVGGSVSSRPHLYELRMGMTGMEQLLSSVIAQSMVPPLLSSTSATSIDENDIKAKMQMPHVVYASSYDARYFSNVAQRINSQQDHQHQYQKNGIVLGEQNDKWHHNHHHSSPPRGFHGVSHLINEILATSYHGLHGLSTIGLRFDAIYGPRGFGAPSTSVPILNVNRMRKNVGVSSDVALAEAGVRRLYRKWMNMIKKNNEEIESSEDDDEEEEEAGGHRRLLEEKKQLSLIEEAGWVHASHHPRDFVFVDDAVGSIIAAMQYRAVPGSPTTFNIGSGETNTLSTFADKIEQVVSDGNQSGRAASKAKSVIDVERSNAARSASYTSNEYLGWSAKTSLKDGITKLMAWHLDRSLPSFPSSTLSDEEVDYSNNEKGVVKHMDGKELLSKNKVDSCSDKDDATCLTEKHSSYPCASECSPMTCSSSIFDSVLPLVHDSTDGCYLVLYTAPLGYDLESLEVETEYSDSGTTFEYHEGSVCTIAFVPSESTLVRDVIDDLPANTLSMLDASPSDSYTTKLKKLNGHLAHKGWLLIFVDGAAQPLAPEELLIPKLAPARLFHSSVRRAMYVDEKFAHTPYPEDALFLATQTYRGVMKSRNIMGPDSKGQKTKYKLPEEPQRYAVMLVSKMREIEDSHISLRQVTKTMMNENGFDSDAHELKELKTQREFYERARSLINSMDLRSQSDPTYRHKLEIKDFIRSQWVVYNLKLEEGHQVRCEWYREHSRWAGSNTLESGMDQLSFAYVMAKRELSRKIVTKQPLPKELSLLEKVIKAATDAHEWHPIFSGDGSTIPLHSVTSTRAEAIPTNIADRPEFDLDKVEPETVSTDTESTYYVRIISDDVMMKARKEWAKFVAKFENQES